MKLTILGCSGSLSAPGNPASGYLITVDNAPSVLMDIGPGVLASLQEVQNPSDTHVVASAKAKFEFEVNHSFSL